VFTLGELADRLDLAFSGDAQRVIVGLAPLERAGPAELTFLAGKTYLSQLAHTQAAAVIIGEEFAPQCPVDTLVSTNPYLSYARATRLFCQSPQPARGVHASAVVSVQAQVHASAAVGPRVVIEAGAEVAADVILDAGVYLGHNSRVGPGSRVYPNAVIYHDVWLGSHCVVHSHAVLGADGFGFAQGPEGWEKIHQLGGVRIGSRVEIGAGTTVDRGALDHTVIEDGVIIDNLVQIGHNCRIGRNTAIAGCCGLAGSTTIGANCTLAGGVGVVGHVDICDSVHVTGMTMVTRSISEPGSYSSGTPMDNTAQWKRNAVRFSQLDTIARRLAALERQR
jgi:UDP-3-O-[3-hydroxymyristoyl] glucosamine N-acyltransferase